MAYENDRAIKAARVGMGWQAKPSTKDGHHQAPSAPLLVTSDADQLTCKVAQHRWSGVTSPHLGHEAVLDNWRVKLNDGYLDVA